MAKNIYARTIYFLCEDTSKPHHLIHQVEKLLSIDIPRIEPNELMLAMQQHKHKILMIDHNNYQKLNNQIRDLPLSNKMFETIIFNVEKRLTTEELLRFGNLKALFYQEESIEAVAKGCGEVINSQNWLPRKVAAQLLHYYRHVVLSQTAPATVDLTAREIQILRCLKTGASNMQIAEDLFISEFTVKSHLYQIFKKLSVKNRVQAIAWANQHMMS
ncbi:LuxR C-terminal-related transcriptional regulator [Vibrio sp. Isolate25]|uniref:LuxR C-terminal-related transcriptional regulator n=1 Tax=Vibrio TaxID=662 RepID=UPI001EFEE943|nr:MULTISPECIES: LuxR C-terminal-related transcriptional regulator [Vibrio]MCG9598783.1 LuxR C-terminal-related transcriptional regulator [Vibrio sp. Isolate25]MCG9680732.1 LuxR C-terminal-related transcriptional regulator [Vibrio sp. Isolate24]USD32863.1 DNA-binding response regulator [Vibrio sp. SCSIO 43186]USD45902.1 DNA-binding response regulator [Vibrio sp. SCSIO 43145]USD69988.1 DNA-binding response regulator [Vibrio sp. SCSIO 43139]